jgi:integrase
MKRQYAGLARFSGAMVLGARFFLTALIDNLEKKTLQIVDETRQRKASSTSMRSTKSGRSRILPLHPNLLEMLLKKKRWPDGLVFQGPAGGKPKPDTIRTIFVRDVLEPLAASQPDQTGSGFVTGRLHSFRHYFCSMCSNQGIPERVVMAWLGHSSSQMIRRYYHLHDEESQRQMGKLSRLQKPEEKSEEH